jgi:RDD family
MRCPKCHYISFGSVDRCRNCGYEFSLAADAKPLDLPIQPADQPIGPLGDLQLGDRPTDVTAQAALANERADRPSPGQRGAAAPRMDLPLFIDRDPLNDAPLISAPSAPRQPLSVRRAPPAVPKPGVERGAAQSLLQPGPRDAWIDADAGAENAVVQGRGEPPSSVREPVRLKPEATSRTPVDVEEDWQVASVLSRFAAGLIDVLILGAIDSGVLFATLRVLGLTIADVGQLPPIPLIVFLLLLNGGYLTIFTVAGGQTIGKMIAGIKVIAQRPEDDRGFDDYSARVTMGSAVLRACAYIVSLLPAGLGSPPSSSTAKAARFTIGSPKPASSKRDSSRRFSRDRRVHRIFPHRAGDRRVGGRPARLRARLVDAIDHARSRVDRRVVRRGRLGGIDRRAILRRHRSGPDRAR